MEHTKVSCRFLQTDCIDNTQTVLYEGEVFSKLGYLTYTNELGKQEFFFDENSMIILRDGEVKTEVNLYKEKQGNARVISEYGELHFTTKIEEYDLKSDSWCIEYKIFSEDAITIHTRIEYCIFKN
ncbi:DUF1934 family protein [Anaerorhabdus furcosa]|uniref:DUF1934 domain-containing protein n=1 Tax=Anaerorhabdus furcosa TaxID=118967 RepID=A0A1T4KCI2_9FIRM|nr:DUF1934 family protein [Anaerorhabdus furcosa]SJZ40154.1 protein of unknown function [Anaerorhabdus furcosa]